MLPRIDLPDLLLEVHAWTGFLDAVHPRSAALGPRMDDLPVSVAALLVAEACNVGLTPVTDPDSPALTRDRLSHVDQNYLRADTHAAANARLIEAQARVPSPGVGRRAARLGGRTAVRRPRPDHQRRALAEVLRLPARA